MVDFARTLNIIFSLYMKYHRVLTGRLIKRFRQKKGLSQMALAELIGVSYQQVQKYESGRSSISIERLQDIARALDIPVTMFFPSEKEALSEEESPYCELTEEEKRLLEHFRRIKDRNTKKAILRIIEETSKEK